MKPYLDGKESHLSTTQPFFKLAAAGILKIRNSILFTVIFVAFTQVCWGQAIDDFGSIASGNWNGTSTWGKWNGTSFYPTTSYPNSTSTNVFIRNGFPVTMTGTISVNTLTIESGGSLNANTRILNVYGDFINNGTFTYGTGTVTMKGILVQNIGGSSTTSFYNLTIGNISSEVKASKSFNVLFSMIIIPGCSFNPNPSVVINSSSATGSLTSISSSIKVTHAGEATGDYLSQYKFSTKTVLTIEFIGSTPQIIDPIGGGFTTLIINNPSGCTLGSTTISNEVSCGSLNILSGVLTIPTNGTLNVSNNIVLGGLECLVLKSNSILTGSLVHLVDNPFSGPGTVKIERFMSHNDLWHLYSSPIGYVSTDFKDSLSIHNFLKYNPEIPDIVSSSGTAVGMRKYSTTSDLWGDYLTYGGTDATPGSMMTSGRGFSIRTINNYNDNGTIIEGTGTVDAIGIPNDNIVYYTLDKGGDRWNLMGNPFTCSMDGSAFLTLNGSLLESSYQGLYLWDSVNGNYTTDINDVQLGQGFFVKSKIDVGKIEFNSDMQSPNSSAPFKGAIINWPSINITVTNQTLKSSTKIKFVTNTTKGLDPGYDMGILKANPDFALYSKLLEDNGVDFCVQSLPDKNFDQYVVPIGIDFKAGGELTFSTETINLPSGCQALLEDKLTKRFTRLDLKDAKYTAYVSANTKGTGRFFLHTADIISGDQQVENQPFKVYTIGKTVYINGEVNEKANFFIYSMNGKQLASFNASSQVLNQFNASGLPAGVYILTIEDQNQKKSVKFVIEN